MALSAMTDEYEQFIYLFIQPKNTYAERKAFKNS